MGSRVASACMIGALGLAVGSCLDPVHSDAVDALGPEIAGVPRGPLHRAGQPCTVCHGGKGPGEPDFSVAGTVFETRGSATPAEGATVVLEDATGETRTAVTNQAGNFYVTAREWSPTFPMFVEIQKGETVKRMETRIGREGACNACHAGVGDAAHMPGVFLRDR